MGLPEEDKGPAWLRDWSSKTGHTELDTFTGSVDPNALAVDITSLLAFAKALQNEHENDFRPHVRMVFEDMSAAPAQPDARFVELTETMTHHRDMLVQTSTALANHDAAVIAFVQAAEAISKEYRGADAMSSAKVSDVDTQLAAPAAAAAPTAITPQAAQQQTQQPVTQPVTQPATGTGTGPGTTTTGSPDGGKEYTG
jgi:hypothetical protein